MPNGTDTTQQLAPATSPEPVDASGQTAAQLAEQAGVTPQELAAEEQRLAELGTDVNPDVKIGNILSQRKSAVITAKPALARLDQAGQELDQFQQDLPRPTTQLPGVEVPTTQPRIQVGESGLTQLQEEVLQKERELVSASFSQLEQDIKLQVEQQKAEAREAQRLEKGASRSFLARVGALGTNTAANQYINSINDKHQQRMNQLTQAGIQAIKQARIAKTEADFKLLNKQMDLVRQNNLDIQAEKKQAQEDIKFAFQLRELQRADVATTLEAFANNGIDELPDDYAENLDQQAGYLPGTTKGLFNIAKREVEFKQVERTVEIQDKLLSQAKDLQDVLQKVPIGSPVKIGDVIYYGTKGAGEIENVDGFGRIFEVNQATGEVNARSLGFIGKEEDGWVTEVDDNGDMWRVNANSGQMEAMFPNPSRMDEKIPDGAVLLSNNFTNPDGSPMPFQCGELVNLMCGVTVGSTLKEKKRRMDPNLTSANAEVGDVIVTSESTATGHVAVITGKKYRDGKPFFIISEANKSGPGVVTHNRLFPADHPDIQGFINAELQPDFVTGPDAPYQGVSPFDAPKFGEKGKKAAKKEIDLKTRLEIQDKISKEASIQKFTQLNSQFKSLEALQLQAEQALATGGSLAATDQALITLFNKMLDPGSVVRESEFERTPSTLSLFDRAEGLQQKFVKGGVGITQAAREDIVNVSRELLRVAREPFESTVQRRAKQLELEGLDPVDFIPGFELIAEAEQEAALQQTIAQAPTGLREDQSFTIFNPSIPEEAEQIELGIAQGWIPSGRPDGTVVLISP